MVLREPDQPARLVGHAVVALALMQLASRKATLAASLGLAAAGVLAHHVLDEPVAKALSRAGL